jgi:hypothetical protein
MITRRKKYLIIIVMGIEKEMLVNLAYQQEVAY